MKTVFITGCSGYIGSLLVEKITKREDVSLVVGMDMMPLPKFIQECHKLHFIQKNTSGDWEDEVMRYKPDIVIHTAWQIKELFGQRDMQEMWNINGSHQVFDFVFNQSNVTKLIHFGSVASYGAFSGNSREEIFNEEYPLRKSKYLYAEEKRVSEEMLEDLYEKYANKTNNLPKVFVVRPVSVTGEKGRSRNTLNLQSALSGKASDNFFSKLISKSMSFMPITKNWTRQFINEIDVVDAVVHLSFNEFNKGYDTLNLCPDDKYITGEEMAKILNKKSIKTPFLLIKFIFNIAWNVSRGRIPTPKGSDKAYAFPIVVTGKKITDEYGYEYKYTMRQSLDGL